MSITRMARGHMAYRGTRAYARAGGSAPSGRAFWPHEQQARGRHARRPRSFGVTTPGADARDIFGTLAKERKHTNTETKGPGWTRILFLFGASISKNGPRNCTAPYDVFRLNIKLNMVQFLGLFLEMEGTKREFASIPALRFLSFWHLETPYDQPRQRRKNVSADLEPYTKW